MRDAEATAGGEVVLPRFKGRIAPAYATPEFLVALADPAALAAGRGAEVLLDGRNRVVAVRIPLGPDRPPAGIVLKSFGARGFKRLKTLVQPSKAARAWRGAGALAAAGLGTAAPVAYLERRVRGLVAESWFLAERLEGGREVRELFRELPESRLKPLVAALAAELARLHGARLVHRDLSDGNVLVFGAEAGAGGGPALDVPAGEGGTAPLRFAFLDTNRVRRARLGRPNRFARARQLVRLGIPPGLRPFFLARYAAASGGRLEPGFAAFYRLAKGTFSGWIAVRRKLKLRALARKLRIQ